MPFKRTDGKPNGDAARSHRGPPSGAGTRSVLPEDAEQKVIPFPGERARTGAQGRRPQGTGAPDGHGAGDDRSASLEDTLARIRRESEGQDRVSLGQVVETVGRRSFGMLLLVPGLIVLAPILGDIPGVPTLVGLVVLLSAVQLLLGRRAVWLPKWLTRRSLSSAKLQKTLKWLDPVARFLDRFARPRLGVFTHGPGAYAIAFACVLITLALPPMELVPFSANFAGLTLVLFGLALFAHDGALAVLGFAVLGAVLATVGYVLV